MKATILKPCTKCKRSHDTPFKMCASCREKHRVYQAGRKSGWKAEGRCGQCGREPEFGGGFCSACKEYFRGYYDGPGNRAKNRAATLRHRRERADEGWCSRCLVRPADDGFVCCFDCREYLREYQRERK